MNAGINGFSACVFLKLDVSLIRFSVQQIEASVVANAKAINKRCHFYVKALQKVYDPNSTFSRHQLICHINKFGLKKSKLDELLIKEFIQELENCTIGFIFVLENEIIFNMYKSMKELQKVIPRILELLKKYEISNDKMEIVKKDAYYDYLRGIID